MIDFSTQYLGLKLSGPIVVSSTPISESIDNVRRMEDAGASAIVLPSLFEEQLELESRALDEDLSRGTESFAESLGFLPDLKDYRMNQDGYLEHIQRCKQAVKIPVLGSLNGATTGGWLRFAKDMEQAGADAIELNTYALATDKGHTSTLLEGQLLELVTAVTSAVKIPVSVKLSQSFTSIPHLVSQLESAGARGVVMFNRFYQPDFDIETLEVRPTLHFSTPSELLPRLHWAAILYGNVGLDLAISGGVHSAVHIHGIEHIKRVLADVRYWLEKREYTSLWETRGCLSRRSVPDTSTFDRGNYIKTLSSYSLRQTQAAF
jgi:dihydroorotate dehydrogenase (fumarate)